MRLASEVAGEVAGALDCAHCNGVVHRDIKPENIMLHDGHAPVADFGIGKAVSDSASDTLTLVGMSVGTPACMSPEQAVGEEVDGRSDLYCLGCVLYEMLVGEPSFTGQTMQAVIAKRFVQTPLDVAVLREGVPRAVSRAVAQVLARVAVDRHATAGLFVSALNARETASSTSAAPAKSLAILPFENLSADPDNQYVADGVAADLLDALVQIDGLHIAARNSAFSFRGKQVALAEIGEMLQVATVLQGSVRKAGNRMRIAVQLVSVFDGYHLWSERFDRELVDVFAVQDEIAAAIAATLQVTFIPPAQPARKATTAEVEAFELVAKGRALLAQWGRSLLAARECFDAAMRLDPDNADAHALLGETLVNFMRYGLMPVTRGHPLAKAALDRALARQLRLSEVRGSYAVNGLWCIAQDDEGALRELARAVADDPFSASLAGMHSAVLALTEQVAAARAEAQRAQTLDPDSFIAAYGRAIALMTAGDSADTIAAVNEMLTRFGRHPRFIVFLVRAHLMAGDERRANFAYAQLQARAETDVVQRSTLALAASDLGRSKDSIRAHQRYPELLRGMGL